MGIKGLLPFLADIQQPKKISYFAGNVVGVDTYCWIHRGTYSCAKDLVLGQKTDKHISFVMKRVQMLLDFGITPLMVFDGGRLPAKAETNRKRSELKKENKALALQYLEKGDKKKAFEYFQRCVAVTPEMVVQVIEECKKINVSCVVAPYEADAQLAYLYKQKVISLAISEDTDLLVFGCEKVFYKLDGDGNGVLVNMERLSKLKLFPKLDAGKTEMELFRHLCILSGCDYLQNLKGIGMKTALSLLRKTQDVFKLIRDLRITKSTEVVPIDYEENFKFANSMFLNQLVYDIKICSVVEFSTSSKHEFITSDLHKYDEFQIFHISLGNLDPINNKFMTFNKIRDFPLIFEHASKDRVKLLESKSIDEYTKTPTSNIHLKESFDNNENTESFSNQSQYFKKENLLATKSLNDSLKSINSTSFTSPTHSPSYCGNFRWKNDGLQLTNPISETISSKKMNNEPVSRKRNSFIKRGYISNALINFKTYGNNRNAVTRIISCSLV